MSTALIDTPVKLSVAVSVLEERILSHLNEEAVVSLDTLIEMLPEYGWNQIFHAVDHLARLGSIVLRRHRFDYTLFSSNYAA